MARFKGGDNFVFGRGYEEVIACQEAGVPVTVIPGISSPLGGPRGRRHPGHPPRRHPRLHHRLRPPAARSPESLVQWGALASLRGTIVLMMAVENAPLIAEVLLRGGATRRTPVAVVCDGTMPTERTVLTTLGDLAADLADARRCTRPAIIVIGEVVAVAHPERYPRAPEDG